MFMAYLYLKYSSSSMSPKTTALKGTSFFKNARHATLSSNIIVRNKICLQNLCLNYCSSRLHWSKLESTVEYALKGRLTTTDFH